MNANVAKDNVELDRFRLEKIMTCSYLNRTMSVNEIAEFLNMEATQVVRGIRLADKIMIKRDGMMYEFVIDETRPIPINESIPIEKVSRTVSARHLYNYLGYSGSNYSKWVKKHILRNQFAIEGTDYLPFIADRNDSGNYIPNPMTDYRITLDFAEQLTYISISPKKREVLEYLTSLQLGEQPAVENNDLIVSNAQTRQMELLCRLVNDNKGGLPIDSLNRIIGIMATISKDTKEL